MQKETYCDTPYVEQDYKIALKYFKKAADKGDVKALRRCADIYFFGQGIQQNFAEAIRLYSQATNGRDLRSINRLGECHYFGKGAAENEKKPLSFLGKLQMARTACP